MSRTLWACIVVAGISVAVALTAFAWHPTSYTVGYIASAIALAALILALAPWCARRDTTVVGFITIGLLFVIYLSAEVWAHRPGAEGIAVGLLVLIVACFGHLALLSHTNNRHLKEVNQ